LPRQVHSYLLSDLMQTAHSLIHCTYAFTFIYFSYKGKAIGTRYGAGTGAIWLDNLHCIGNETSIANCSHAGWGEHNCEHREDVSVSCGVSPVQYGNFNKILHCVLKTAIYLTLYKPPL